MEDLASLTVVQLKALARKAGVVGGSRMRRAELLEALQGRAGASPAPKVSGDGAKKAGKSVRNEAPAKKGATARRHPPASEPAVDGAGSTPVAAGARGPAGSPGTLQESTAAPSPAIPDEHLGLLPRRYGRDRIYVVPRDSHWFYIHWDLSDGIRQRFEKDLCLRLTFANDEGGTRVLEQPIDPGGPRYYAQARGAEVGMTVEIGVGSGRSFEAVVPPCTVRVPHANQRPGEARFLTVTPNKPLRAQLDSGRFTPPGDEASHGIRIPAATERGSLFGGGFAGDRVFGSGRIPGARH